VKTDFVPKHVEFDTKTEGRFLVHDRDSEKSSLFVTDNYGLSFSKVGDYVHSFFFHYAEVPQPVAIPSSGVIFRDSVSDPLAIN
jgi:hypothetical protein